LRTTFPFPFRYAQIQELREQLGVVRTQGNGTAPHRRSAGPPAPSNPASSKPPPPPQPSKPPPPSTPRPLSNASASGMTPALTGFRAGGQASHRQPPPPSAGGGSFGGRPVSHTSTSSPMGVSHTSSSSPMAAYSSQGFSQPGYAPRPTPAAAQSPMSDGWGGGYGYGGGGGGDGSSGGVQQGAGAHDPHWSQSSTDPFGDVL
jgi:hypothetical protein